jgi:hypothetical protein
MENEVKIPQLEVQQCNRCNRQVVVEVGSQTLCQQCVNEFLARNVGLMQPVVNEPQGVIPLDAMPVEGGVE